MASQSETVVRRQRPTSQFVSVDDTPNGGGGSVGPARYVLSHGHQQLPIPAYPPTSALRTTRQVCFIFLSSLLLALHRQPVCCYLLLLSPSALNAYLLMLILRPP